MNKHFKYQETEKVKIWQKKREFTTNEKRLIYLGYDQSDTNDLQ